MCWPNSVTLYSCSELAQLTLAVDPVTALFLRLKQAFGLHTLTPLHRIFAYVRPIPPQIMHPRPTGVQLCLRTDAVQVACTALQRSQVHDLGYVSPSPERSA